MARKSNRDKAMAIAERMGVEVTREIGGIEVWTYDAHMSEYGCHTYITQDEYATLPAQYRDIADWLESLTPCEPDCECYGARADEKQDDSNENDDSLESDIETIGAHIGRLMATLNGSATEYDNHAWKLAHGLNRCVVSVSRDYGPTTTIVVTDVSGWGEYWTLDMSHVNNMLLTIIEDSLLAVYDGN